MNPNVKNCAYRRCGNSSARQTHLTFFGFPLKNADKCRVWARLAGIDVPSSKQIYLCEDHFNPIFLSRTPRRTVLLPKAVPYAYNACESDDEDKDVSTVDLVTPAAIICDQLEPDDEDDEEVITEPKRKIDDDEHIDSEGSLVFENGSKVEPRTSFDSSQLNCNNVTKRQKVRTNDNFSPANEHTIDNTVANPDIVTFIFRGEEYIQMPKSIYLQQRLELDAELQKYKKLLEKIKHAIDTEM